MIGMALNQNPTQSGLKLSFCWAWGLILGMLDLTPYIIYGPSHSDLPSGKNIELARNFKMWVVLHLPIPAPSKPEHLSYLPDVSPLFRCLFPCPNSLLVLEHDVNSHSVVMPGESGHGLRNRVASGVGFRSPIGVFNTPA